MVSSFFLCTIIKLANQGQQLLELKRKVCLKSLTPLHDLFCWAVQMISTQEQGLMALGLLPVYKIQWRVQMERIKRTRNGEKEGFTRCWEAG